MPVSSVGLPFCSYACAGVRCEVLATVLLKMCSGMLHDADWESINDVSMVLIPSPSGPHITADKAQHPGRLSLSSHTRGSTDTKHERT